MTDQAGPDDAVCTRPLHFSSHPRMTCGRKAVVRLPIGMSGQLTTIYACAPCQRWINRKFPNEQQRWEPLL